MHKVNNKYLVEMKKKNPSNQTLSYVTEGFTLLFVVCLVQVESYTAHCHGPTTMEAFHALIRWRAQKGLPVYFDA